MPEVLIPRDILFIGCFSKSTLLPIGGVNSLKIFWCHSQLRLTIKDFTPSVFLDCSEHYLHSLRFVHVSIIGENFQIYDVQNNGKYIYQSSVSCTQQAKISPRISHHHPPDREITHIPQVRFFLKSVSSSAERARKLWSIRHFIVKCSHHGEW